MSFFTFTCTFYFFAILQYLAHILFICSHLIGCPSSGTFQVHYQMDAPQGAFTNECMMNYLNVTYNPSTGKFAPRPDVSVTITGRETGNTECFGGDTYVGTVAYFVSKGYTINSDSATFLCKFFKPVIGYL